MTSQLGCLTLRIHLGIPKMFINDIATFQVSMDLSVQEVQSQDDWVGHSRKLPLSIKGEVKGQGIRPNLDVSNLHMIREAGVLNSAVRVAVLLAINAR